MASRSRERGETAIKSITANGPKSSTELLELDITSDDSIASAFQKTSSQHDHLDVLINNAGICPVEADDVSRSTFLQTIETNAISPSLVTKAFAPLLLESAEPRVIYVSSVMGSISMRGDQGYMAYHATLNAYRVSKAALNMLACCDAYEYRGKIKVFAFCPGYAVTDLAGQREMKQDQGFARAADEPATEIQAIVDGGQDEKAGLFLYGDKASNVYKW